MEDRQHLQNTSVDSILKLLDEAPSEGASQIDPQYEKSELDSQKLALELKRLELRNKELHDIITLRQSWSTDFRRIVVIVLLFEIGITLAVGLNYLQFNDEWFLRIIVLGGIAQILAMPYLVTQFLFNTKSPLSKGEI